MINYKRQLEILNWCSDNTLQDTLSEIVHPHFRHSYISGEKHTHKRMLDICIVPLSLLAEYYNKDFGIDPDSPNLYIAQFSSFNCIVIEISADETSIIQTILQQRTLPSMSLIQMTDDKALQQEILAVYQDFQQRIQDYRLPCDIITSDYEISLPLPTDDTRLYREKLEWLAKHVIAPTDFKVAGTVARRLRELDMVSDIGSIRGVFLSDYNANTGRSEWATLNLLDHAKHEGRIVGSGSLSLFNKTVNVIVISRDKFIDDGGYFILVIGIGRPYVISISENDVKDTFLFNGDVSNYVGAMDNIDVNKACDNYEDNLRVEGWLLVILNIIEMNYPDVSKITLRQFLMDDYVVEAN